MHQTELTQDLRHFHWHNHGFKHFSLSKQCPRNLSRSSKYDARRLADAKSAENAVMRVRQPRVIGAEAILLPYPRRKPPGGGGGGMLAQGFQRSPAQNRQYLLSEVEEGRIE